MLYFLLFFFSSSFLFHLSLCLCNVCSSKPLTCVMVNIFFASLAILSLVPFYASSHFQIFFLILFFFNNLYHFPSIQHPQLSGFPFPSAPSFSSLLLLPENQNDSIRHYFVKLVQTIIFKIMCKLNN